MPIQLAKTFVPKLEIIKPDETDPNHLQLKLATWTGDAEVLITNEPGKRYKIGFVQVLYDNLIQITYAGSITKTTAGPPPVCDSPKSDWAPWYWRPKAYAPVVDNVVGSANVIAKMGDGPEHPVSWDSPLDSSELLEVSYRLKFKTWLVVRDVTGPKPYPNQFAVVLFQFNTNINTTFNVDMNQPVGKRCAFATTREQKATLDLVTPPSHIHDCIWKSIVANDSVTTENLPRTVIKSTNAPVNVGPTGVNVQAAVSKAPPIMMMAPPPKAQPPQPKPAKSGGFFKKLFHFATLPSLPDDE